jgi:hypothetical protein
MPIVEIERERIGVAQGSDFPSQEGAPVPAPPNAPDGDDALFVTGAEAPLTGAELAFLGEIRPRRLPAHRRRENLKLPALPP